VSPPGGCAPFTKQCSLVVRSSMTSEARGWPPRARSGAEIRALIVLRAAGCATPRLNHGIAGEEAHLSWPEERLIIEIDGGPFHQDIGEDARKEAVWSAAGWCVLRVPSEVVYDAPEQLVALAPPARTSVT
jgi:Protein of unknown function (DUF559)